MVGVPGRSKGCVTCRRRKKGCDKNVPSCHQCIRSGLICGGYGRDLVWVNTTPDGKKAKPPSSSSHQMPWNAIYTKSDGSQTEVSLHHSFARSAREQLFFGMFISAAMPYGHLLSTQALGLSTNGWLAAIDEFYNNEACIRYAALAMSAGIIGIKSHNSHLCVQGLNAYNRSVRELIRALKDPQRSKGDGVIAAARVMQTYELFFGRAPDWRAHVEGQLALFINRGPEAFTSGQGHQLYVDGRILIVMLAIGRRVRSPLNSPKWRTVPWRLRPKTAKDKLIDILENIPDMLIKYDTLRACESPGQVEELRRITLQSCQQIESDLDVWEKESGVDLEKFDYLISGSPLPIPQDDTEFGILYISSVYWGARLILYTTIGTTMMFVFGAPAPGSGPPGPGVPPPSRVAVATPPPVPVPAPAPVPVPSAQPSKALLPVNANPKTSISPRNPKFYAFKIVHLVHLFFEPTAGVMQGATALFPMALALRFFAATEPPGQRSKESQMLFDVFNMPFMGTFVGRFLNDLQGGPTESPEARREADQNIWWYEVLGREKVSRSPSP